MRPLRFIDQIRTRSTTYVPAELFRSLLSQKYWYVFYLDYVVNKSRFKKKGKLGGRGEAKLRVPFQGEVTASGGGDGNGAP